MAKLTEDERLFRKIEDKIKRAIFDYGLINDGDRILVGLSGGKDSLALVDLLGRRSKIYCPRFEVVVAHIVMTNIPYCSDREYLRSCAEEHDLPFIVHETSFDPSTDTRKSPCFLCSWTRRKALFEIAKAHKCNKIALGHHFDDVIETILMGMFYGGKVETMMPKLHSQNFEGMELIRPMYLIKEDDIIAWRDYNQLNFIQCACRFTENCVSCGGGRGSKRDEMKELIKEFRKQGDIIEKNIFRSVHNVNLRTIIGYHKDDMEYNFLDDYNERGK